MPCVWETGPSLQRAGFFYVERIVSVVPIPRVIPAVIQVHKQADLILNERVESHFALDAGTAWGGTAKLV